MGENGWVKLWRSCETCPALNSDEAEGVWSRLLRLAARKPTAVNWKGQTIQVAAGEVCLSVRAWSRERGTSYQRLRTIFDRFEREGMIEHRPIFGAVRGAGVGAVGMVVTICNYLEYQANEDTSNAVVNAASTHQQRSSNAQNKKERIKEGKKEILSPNGDSSFSTTEREPKSEIMRAMVDTWNRICGDLLPAARPVGKTRQQHMLARFAEMGRNLELWELVCKRVRASRFLTGQAKPTNGHAPFSASLDWVVAPSNFVKIREGNYDNDRRAQPETIEQWAARLAAEHAERHGYH